MRPWLITLFKLGIVLSLILSGIPVIQAAAQELQPAEEAPPGSDQPLEGDFIPGEVVVGLAPGADLDNVTSQLNQGLRSRTAVGSPKQELPELNATVIQVPSGQEEETARFLSQNPDVLFAEPNYIVRTALDPDDPAWNDPSHTEYIYGPEHVQARTAWDITTGSSDVILAIVDTGLDTGTPANIHPEFSGRVLPGYDFVDKDSIPQDTGICYSTHNHHGTHVAGIAAATGNNEIGIAGINWGVKILPVRVLNACDSGSVANVAAGIDYAVSKGAKIINLSLGLSTDSSLIRQATYNAYRKGVAVIAAAGNNYGGSLLYPAAYPWVLAVGATDQNDARASLSNIGSGLDIMAPGVAIYSTQPNHSPENGYGLKTGTSMATPFVSGAAALLAGQPLFNSPDKIYYALTHNALDIGSLGFDNYTGNGLLQIHAALEEDLSDFIPTLSIEYDLLSSERCSSEEFDWLDATDTNNGGTQTMISGNDDYENLKIPFSFTYANEVFPVDYKVKVNSNGYIAFSSEYDTYSVNQQLPSVSAPIQMIAPFWDDLNPSACDPYATHCGVYYRTFGTTPNRRFVIEWYRIPFNANRLQEISFEVILFEGSGQIGFQYLNPSGTLAAGESATIGLNYDNGKDGVIYSFNRPGSVKKGLSIRIIPRTPGQTATYSPGCLYTASVTPGEDQTFQLGNFCLNIPAGLVPLGKLVDFTISPFSSFAPLPAYTSLHRFADIFIKPSPPLPLDPSPSVCYNYSNSDVLAGGGHPENLFIAAYDEQIGQWQHLPTSVDTGKRMLTAPASHFSVFGIFGSRTPQSLPATGAPFSPSAAAGMGFIMVGLICLSIWFNRRR